jgi:hypothetical protein
MPPRRFHTYSLNNQLLITLQAAWLGISPTRVAGFGTWKSLGRSVVKGSIGLAVLAPCTYTRRDTGTDQAVPAAAPTATTAAGTAGEPAGGDADRPAGARVLRGFRIAHVFDISPTEGDPLPAIVPELLTGEAPAALWQALAAQVAGHGYTLVRETWGQANGDTDPAARTVRVRLDVADAQAVKTLAHELAHIECGHTAEVYDYRGCRGGPRPKPSRSPTSSPPGPGWTPAPTPSPTSPPGRPATPAAGPRVHRWKASPTASTGSTLSTTRPSTPSGTCPARN